MRDTSPDFVKPINEMTESERMAAATRLEEQRLEVIREIEDIMAELSGELRQGKYKRRRFKLGKSPNDFGAK